jgi:hypothetical protein
VRIKHTELKGFLTAMEKDYVDSEVRVRFIENEFENNTSSSIFEIEIPTLFERGADCRMRSKDTIKNMTSDVYRIRHINSGMLMVVQDKGEGKVDLCLLKDEMNRTKEEIDSMSLFRFIRQDMPLKLNAFFYLYHVHSGMYVKT